MSSDAWALKRNSGACGSKLWMTYSMKAFVMNCAISLQGPCKGKRIWWNYLLKPGETCHINPVSMWWRAGPQSCTNVPCTSKMTYWNAYGMPWHLRLSWLVCKRSISQEQKYLACKGSREPNPGLYNMLPSRNGKKLIKAKEFGKNAWLKQKTKLSTLSRNSKIRLISQHQSQI